MYQAEDFRCLQEGEEVVSIDRHQPDSVLTDIEVGRGRGIECTVLEDQQLVRRQ
jgi:hypothetical protein